MDSYEFLKRQKDNLTRKAAVKEQKLARLEVAGTIVRDCKGCAPWYEHPRADPFAPCHKASPRCESGGRDHCTCDICF